MSRMQPGECEECGRFNRLRDGLCRRCHPDKEELTLEDSIRDVLDYASSDDE